MEDFCSSWLFGLFALGLQLPELKHQDFKALKKRKRGSSGNIHRNDRCKQNESSRADHEAADRHADRRGEELIALMNGGALVG